MILVRCRAVILDSVGDCLTRGTRKICSLRSTVVVLWGLGASYFWITSFLLNAKMTKLADPSSEHTS